MSRIIYFSAMIVNCLALLSLGFILLTQANRTEEIMILALCMFVPILSIAAIYSAPDLEERKLMRALNKAQLRKELTKFEK